MHLDFFYGVFAASSGRRAFIQRDQVTTYAELLERCTSWRRWLDDQQVVAGTVVAFRADYSPDAVALLLELVRRGAIVLQAGLATGGPLEEILTIGQAEAVLALPGRDGHAATLETRPGRATHTLYQQLRERGRPGLVLFSSGSSGTVKGTVHDLSRFAEKYRIQRHDLRTVAFLRFDHVGGIDTLLYCLSNGSSMILLDERDPSTVCAAVERHHAEVLPVAPTFLNLLYFSGEYARHDLSSLKYVTYGAEVMPEATLQHCQRMFPGVKIVQKYGTSEIGTPRSQSRSSDSLWVKLGGDGFAWRVVDGLLQIKAAGAMLGYLNAPSPFTEDGWFMTGDRVEVDGEYLRILGRESDMINVGGRKVYPAEVEAVLQELPGVAEVSVYGEANSLLGQIVAARVWLRPDASEQDVKQRLRPHARSRLESYKIPVRVTFAHGDDYATERFKKVRRPLRDV